MDRWFAQFELFNDIDAIGSSYACRVRDNSRYEVVEARPLSDESLSLNVLSDEIVKLGAGSPRSKSPNHPVRLIRVRLSASRTLWTGGKPTLRTFEMVCLYLQGWADQDELIAHLKKLKPPVA